MNCTQAREVFPELLDPRTPATALTDIRTHLAGCPECQHELAAFRQTLTVLDTMPTSSPTPRLRRNFYAMLEQEKLAATAPGSVIRESHRPHVPLWAWIFAPLSAAALVVLSFIAGQRSAPAPTSAAPSAETVALRDEIKSLQSQVSKMGQLVGYSLLQQQSKPTTDRLRGVLTSATLENPNDKVLNDLIGALATDPSANVRLRALEALYQHASQDVVRAGVLASLTREQNPLVQVSMIDFLAAARDREAAPTLEKLSASETADRSVRDAAKRALTQL